MSRPETEILVHIAAPAKAADDVKYRSLAAAYLDFEPTSRTSIATGVGEEWGTGQEAGCDTHHAERESTQPEDWPQSFSDRRFINSPLMSFRSAINNFNSPRPQRVEEGGMPESQLSWRAPPSVVEDSMPDNVMAFPQYCTPSRILEHYTSAFDSSQSDISPSHRSRPSGTPHAPRFLEAQPTVIPHSPTTSTKRPAPTKPMHTTTVEETHIASSYPSQQELLAPLLRSDSEPLLKRPRICPDLDLGKPLVRSASDIGPRQPKAHTPDSSPQIPETLEIISPAPITSQKELRPQDMITEVLARLARELNLEKRFKPESQTRDLRPFERGYWLVDCTSWDPDLKRSAWIFLTDYLGKGTAGWGTSCKRDPGFSWIRLYCWGCVVGHMYLVVYLMSRRKILYTGTSWVGADGKDVVVMGARPGPV